MTAGPHSSLENGRAGLQRYVAPLEADERELERAGASVLSYQTLPLRGHSEEDTRPGWCTFHGVIIPAVSVTRQMPTGWRGIYFLLKLKPLSENSLRDRKQQLWGGG